MPRVKTTPREDPRLTKIRADLKSMRTLAMFTSEAAVAKKSGINTRTLQKHVSEVSSMRIGELLAYMDTCGCREIVIRREP